jgi:hypothetical protein
MAALDFCRRTGLRFDERYNLTGGEDTAFHRDAKRLGAVSAWAPKALVEEEAPPTRLTIGYQFRRTRDQSIVSFYRKYEDRPWRRWYAAPIFALYKTLAGTGLLLLVPFTGGATLLDSMRAFGFATGRIAGLMSLRSTHYATTTGH